MFIRFAFNKTWWDYWLLGYVRRIHTRRLRSFSRRRIVRGFPKIGIVVGALLNQGLILIEKTLRGLLLMKGLRQWSLALIVSIYIRLVSLRLPVFKIFLF